MNVKEDTILENGFRLNISEFSCKLGDSFMVDEINPNYFDLELKVAKSISLNNFATNLLSYSLQDVSTEPIIMEIQERQNLEREINLLMYIIVKL